jgi:hypothetical protein
MKTFFSVCYNLFTHCTQISHQPHNKQNKNTGSRSVDKFASKWFAKLYLINSTLNQQTRWAGSRTGILGCLIIHGWAGQLFSFSIHLPVWQSRFGWQYWYFNLRFAPLSGMNFLEVIRLSMNSNLPWPRSNPALLPAPTPVFFAKNVIGLA